MEFQNLNLKLKRVDNEKNRSGLGYRLIAILMAVTSTLLIAGLVVLDYIIRGHLMSLRVMIGLWLIATGNCVCFLLLSNKLISRWWFSVILGIIYSLIIGTIGWTV